MPLVSVVMPVYNGERFLAEAIESILAQTFTDFELIIVDDGSRDRSIEIIRDFEKCDERIRVIQHETNRGQAEALNTGTAIAEGDYITTMDCDDVSLPERLRKQVDNLESHPELGAAGAWGRTVKHDMSPYWRIYHTPKQHALIAWELLLFLDEAVLGASLMYRRDVLISVGGFEPGRRDSADLELQSRLLFDAKVRFGNVTEELYIYRIHNQPKTYDKSVQDRKLAFYHVLRRRNLERLWGEAPQETLDRFWHLRDRGKLSWRARRLAKRDCKRLIDAMIARNWIDPGDKPLLIAEMNRLLERASPRLWQMFRHWLRHRFGQ